MKKYFVLLAISVIPVVGFSQSRFFVNLNAGWDHTTDKYYNYNNYEFFDNDGNEYSYGASVGMNFSDVVRFRLASVLGQYSYGQYYSGSNLLKTTMTLKYFSISPYFDFRVWTKNKFELFLSPGLKLEYISDSDQETAKTDGSVSDGNYVSNSYADKMAGFAGSAILKYSFNKHLGVTLTPEYTLYFKQLYEQNDSNMKRFSTRLGVEWHF
ncbi:outer membrane beta-barrel protein [Mangrovibacterium marinum]|uniref:Outer membrane protein with beta-barrel domain n=1 Tax=Mangrovibacterium marinum TaxID=1639118 RepID=A0A2T5C4Y6_9BACT|nr:outer membrane beta-barrel protein [Mangrovibacterium marinum]PTN09924.1 outer membrane protein with beta-barrel domain [Mangrovibacterium marinum]